MLIFAISGGVYALFPLGARWFKKRAEEITEEKHLRGAKLLKPEEINEAIRKDGAEVSLDLGEIKMPVSVEPRHLLGIGTTGVGKTVATNRIIEQIRQRGERAVMPAVKRLSRYARIRCRRLRQQKRRFDRARSDRGQ